MKLHQLRTKQAADKATDGNPQQPAAPRYKIRAVYENNFKVGSKQYYGLENSNRSLMYSSAGFPGNSALKQADKAQEHGLSPIELSPASTSRVIPILYNVDLPFRLRTATDDEPEEPARLNSKVHSFKLYSLPTADLEVFKKDMGCCAHLHKVEYEAHQDKARCC